MDTSDVSELADGGDEPVAVIVAEPTGSATPFSRVGAVDQPARIRLQQISPTHFKLLEGFRYDGRGGQWEVQPRDLPATDLASIPRVLGWFANSYGKHTLAALLHDHLVRNGRDLELPVERHEADEVFLHALDELAVPFVRARIMWAAVVSATRWRRRRTSLAMALWSLAAVIGVILLVWSALVAQPLVLLAALVAPVPFAALWGRRDYKAGLVGGYTLWFVAIPTIVNFVFFAVYSVAERVAQWCRLVRPAQDLPRPSGPPTFKDR